MNDDEIKKNDEALFEEMKDLMNVPKMKMLMAHKFQELKGLLKTDIDHYLQIKERLNTPASPDFSEAMEFQILKPGKRAWSAVLVSSNHLEIKPIPDIHGLFPRELIDFIVSQIPSPDGLVSKNEFTLSTLPHRVFNFSFKKIHDHLFTGTLSERKISNIEVLSPRQEPSAMDNVVDMEVLNTLFTYLLRDKILYKHMVLQFLFVWKQLIDEKR